MQSAKTRETTHVPSWEALAKAAAPSDDWQFATDVARLRATTPSGPYRFGRLVINTLLRDPCYQKFLDFGWSDIIDIMADQVRRNRQLTAADGADSATPISDRTHRSFFRPHAQMPCTRETTAKRVEKIGTLVARDTPILLLGDDDFVSVDLALAGFTDVTAIDICEDVLAEINRIARLSDLKIKTACHDLSKPPPATLRRPYGLVSFDPHYSVAGVKLFLDAALDFTSNRSGTQFLACLHLLSLSRQGLPELEALLRTAGVEIREFEQGFNAYPAPRRLKGLIHLVNRIVIGSKTLSTEGNSFPYFFSDLMLLRKT